MANQKKESMPNAHLHQLFVDELRDIYSAEKQLLKALKKLSSSAESDRLKEAFDKHYKQTEGHIERLKKSVRIDRHEAEGKKMQGDGRDDRGGGRNY